MESRTTRHADGTVDVVQSLEAGSVRPAADLQRLYWQEVRRVTLGLVRFRGDAIRILGLWPTLIRFGPFRDGTRPIVGGLFSRGRQGRIRWAADGTTIVVAVERFAPLLRGPLWEAESWFHGLVGRRFLARAARGD